MGWFPDVNERLAAPILIRRVGALGALRVGARVRAAQRAGEPFVGWEAPADEKERASREQIGPAIALYRALGECGAGEVALDVTREVVVAATLVWLREQIGGLSRAELARLDDEAREAFACGIGERFFNADMRWEHVREESVRFVVERCRFPEICARAGVPELAPIFCEGDAAYFGGVEPGVELVRPVTLAGGGGCCDFTIRWT